MLLQTGVVLVAVKEQATALEQVAGAGTVTGLSAQVLVVLSVNFKVRLPPEMAKAELAALVEP